jgi:hypothetical protein
MTITLTAIAFVVGVAGAVAAICTQSDAAHAAMRDPSVTVLTLTGASG